MWDCAASVGIYHQSLDVLVWSFFEGLVILVFVMKVVTFWRGSGNEQCPKWSALYLSVLFGVHIHRLFLWFSRSIWIWSCSPEHLQPSYHLQFFKIVFSDVLSMSTIVLSRAMLERNITYRSSSPGSVWLFKRLFAYLPVSCPCSLKSF